MNTRPIKTINYEKEWLVTHAGEEIFSALLGRAMTLMDLCNLAGLDPRTFGDRLSGEKTMTLDILAVVSMALGKRWRLELRDVEAPTDADA